jgi:G3E family GTPase
MEARGPAGLQPNLDVESSTLNVEYCLMPSSYIMVGGFLGAGKTTLIQRFAKYIDGKGHKVGLITNDQGVGLVDSMIGRSNQFPVEEISGGCFCCRFNSLIDAATSLGAENRPDVFLAEPVGSCTDLVATVSLPLQQIYGDDYRVSPLSVLVDPVRAGQILGIIEGKKFSDNVTYIYRKQLEEAEFIVINKLDLLDPKGIEDLRAALEREFPEAKVFELSAREGSGCEKWFEAVLSAEMNSKRFLDIDYEKYGEGEALLGWLNAAVEIKSDGRRVDEFDGNELLESIAAALRTKLEEAGAEVAHLKMTLNPSGDPMEIAAINLVRGDSEPELSHRLYEPLDEGELLLNIRAEVDPDTLERAADAGLEQAIAMEASLLFRITHLEHFRPGMPTPTHRVTPDNV